jgi:predicted nucleic acid-binding protein
MTMMPNRAALFVDTSGWADPVLQYTIQHQAMFAFARQLASTQRRLVTTNYVITEAFTSDHHFTQAGFIPVP